MYSKRRYYFLTVAELKSITKAAAKLHVSQPSLTQYLNKLEAEFQVRLIDRNYTPIRLTDAGQLYYHYLKEALEKDRKLLASLERIRLEEHNRLYIGVPMQKTDGLARSVFPTFISAYPDIDLHITEGTSTSVRASVENEEIELGFAHSVSASDPRFDMEIISTEKTILICNAKNPMVQGHASTLEHPCQIEPSLLNEQLFYDMPEGYYLHDVAWRELDRYQLSPRHRLSISNLRTVVSTIAANEQDGFAFMPDYVLEDIGNEEIRRNLAYFKIGEEDLVWHFVMFRKKGKKLSKPGSLFWNMILHVRKS